LGLILVVAAPLALHLLFRGAVPDDARSLPWWAEVLFATLAAVGGTWLLAFGLYDEHVTAGVYTSSDFEEYCSIVGRLRDGDWPEQTQRSLLAAWPSAQFARFGMLDGMAVAGLISTLGTSLGLYLWGRALHGPVAGAAAVLAAGALGPMVLLSHDLSFYPESVAVFTLAAAACAAALRWRSWKTCLVLGVMVGACLLVDLKGLVWALSFAGLGLLAALSTPRRIPLRLAALLLPIALSYPPGTIAYPELTSSLEHQADLSQRMEEYGLSFDDSAVKWDSSYVWGRSDPLEIPYTLHTVWALGQGIPEAYADSSVAEQRWAWRVGGLRPLGVVIGAALVLLCVRRRSPWLVLALVGTAVPFAAALDSALRIHQAFPRHLATGLPFLVVWAGVAWSALLDGWPDRRAVRDWRLRPGLGLGLLAAMVWGSISTDLSPSAEWRKSLDAENQDIRRLAPLTVAVSSRPRERDCVQAFQADRRAGLDAFGSVYGGIASDPTRRD
jgi:hypothetical protein